VWRLLGAGGFVLAVLVVGCSSSHSSSAVREIPPSSSTAVSGSTTSVTAAPPGSACAGTAANAVSCGGERVGAAALWDGAQITSTALLVRRSRCETDPPYRDVLQCVNLTYAVAGEPATFDITAIQVTGLASVEVGSWINADVARLENQFALDFFNQVAIHRAFLAALTPGAVPADTPWFGSYDLHVRRADAKVLSVLWEGGKQSSGLHPGNTSHGSTFDLRDGHQIGLDELFDGGLIPTSVEQQVSQKLSALYQPFSTNEFNVAGGDAMRNGFTLSPTGVEFNFAAGAVASYYQGPATVTISYDSIATESHRLGPQGSLR
jgi:hypothetical protein